jgi:hypothetical protein
MVGSSLFVITNSLRLAPAKRMDEHVECPESYTIRDEPVAVLTTIGN